VDYDSLETELVGVLNSYFESRLLGSDPDVFLKDAYQARRMPENQAELIQEYDKGLINVQYSDSTYGATKATDQVQQEETVMVICYVQCDKMKGERGGYKLLRCMKKALLGYKPADATEKMVISSYGDWRVEEGEMRPFVEFSFKTLNIQEVEDRIVGTIDSEGTIGAGGNLTEVDSDLYINDQEQT